MMAWYIMSRDTPPPLRKMGGSRVGKVLEVVEYCRAREHTFKLVNIVGIKLLLEISYKW